MLPYLNSIHFENVPRFDITEYVVLLGTIKYVVVSPDDPLAISYVAITPTD